MISENAKIDLIDKHLANKLTDEEQILFNKLMTDEDFRQEVENHKNSVAWIKAAHKLEVKKEVRQLFDEFQNQKRTRKLSFHSIRWYAAAAAVLLVASLVWLNVGGDSKASLYGEYYLPYHQGEVRGNEVSMLQEGMALYNSDDFANAVVSFRSTLKENPEEKILLIYMGNCYMQLKDWGNAKLTLSEAMLADDQVVAQHAKWYMALTMIQLNDTPSSQALLKELSNKSLYEKEAKSLLYRIE